MATTTTTMTVTIKASETTSYATALRAHLSAALAYMRIDNYEAAEAELDCLDECAGAIRLRVNQKLYNN